MAWCLDALSEAGGREFDDLARERQVQVVQMFTGWLAFHRLDPSDLRDHAAQFLAALRTPGGEGLGRTPGAQGGGTAPRAEPEPPTSEEPPGDQSVDPKKSSSWGGVIGTVVVVLAVLLLYAQNTSFAGAVSEYLHDPIENAEAGDCVHFGFWEKDGRPYRKWVEVPCWSAAATHKVNNKLYGPQRLDATASSPKCPLMYRQIDLSPSVALCAAGHR